MNHHYSHTRVDSCNLVGFPLVANGGGTDLRLPPPLPPHPLHIVFGIMWLGTNPHQSIHCKGFKVKVFRNKDLTENSFAALPIWEQMESCWVLSGLSKSAGKWLSCGIRSVSEDGHSSALANPISLLRMARGMSVRAITRWM